MPRVRRCKANGCHEFALYPDHYCRKHKDLEQHEHQRDKRTTWHYNHVTRYRNDVKGRQNKFYHSKEWRLIRQEVLQRDFSLCRYCRQAPANVVDHIVPIEFDSSQMRDLDNLASCCRDCHQIKTRWEQSYYGTGLGNSLKDVVPIADIKLISKLMNAMRAK